MFEIFSLIFLKVISMLLSVVIGFLSGKFTNVERDSIASLLFYFIAPIVFFSIPANSNITLNTMSFTLVMFCLASLLCFASYQIHSRYLYQGDGARNILAMSAGDGNVGYFMLPIASSLFDDYTLSIYLMAVVGVNLYAGSVGFYVCARSFSSTKESIKKVFKMPILHAFALGSIYSFLGFNLPGFLNDFISSMKSTFSILGMLMIGLGLATLDRFEIDLKFTLSALSSKFIMYPIVINIFILLDQLIFNCYTPSHYQALRLLSTAPMAANTIVLASIMKFSPEKVAAAVLLSCVLSLVYIPLMASIFFRNIN